ncbi:MAG: hypothetical protein ABSG52_15970 [Terriglobales bacterium]|jgi:hypothetical protein
MSTQGQQFEIHIRSNSSSPEAWRRAMEAPASELQPLTEEQKEIVRRFGITDEEYARGELAVIFGQERLRRRGEELGSLVQDLLRRLSDRYVLESVLYEGANLRWIVRIGSPKGVRNIAVSRELADDVLDSRLTESMQQLKQRIQDGFRE